MSICRSLQLLNATDVYPRSRGCLPCFWVILPWKEARSWIPEKEQSLQTTGQSLSAVLLSPLSAVFYWDGLSLKEECSSAVFLDTLSSRVPPPFSQHALWLQPTCEISMALLMREQVPSHSCRAIFQGTALTSDAWPTVRASSKILAALITFLSSLVLIA